MTKGWEDGSALAILLEDLDLVPRAHIMVNNHL